ncbi:MAG: hypothetical protein HZA06_06985 [Nitrospirae bacterium]|nr:hypothetical protein [Nitrospirota bacterium]
MRKQAKKPEIKKLKQALTRWQKDHEDINSLRKAYQEKVLDWVVKSMEFEKEPVNINRLKELLKKEKTALAGC